MTRLTTGRPACYPMDVIVVLSLGFIGMLAVAPPVAVGPPPQPTVQLLAPSAAVVRPPVPDQRAVRRSIRKFRRGGVAVVAAGGVGLAAAVGLQIGRGVLLNRCAVTRDPESDRCVGSDLVEESLRRYALGGMAMMVASGAGAGGLFGNAAATRDVQQRRRKPKVPSFAKFTGAVGLGLTAAWALGRNLHYSRQETNCDGDVRCIAKVRPKRWIANDIATLALSAGAGFVGYALAYEKQGKALMALRAQPVLSRQHAGASVAISF